MRIALTHHDVALPSTPREQGEDEDKRRATFTLVLTLLSCVIPGWIWSLFQASVSFSSRNPHRYKYCGRRMGVAARTTTAG
jgi:hypothetical protein